ncbi:cation diffusion facilitator family transporter [Novosphingobium sp. BW1]|uniref:cation diffusion facilitator family transporter n=1 Tax=Novosphingobium sp. BW1 TaxID=2592621 RepID=UPI0011DE627F|nr:cation diffusion facilitator family transporter [Novosphingobium sp. BW1]TYC84953.1 cation transporter [Novosphingobium sp. BW1]
MSECGWRPAGLKTTFQPRALCVALGLNAVMFVVDTAAGLHADSASLLADGLDMATDASVYAVALLALAFLVGVGVVLEPVLRAFAGAEPDGLWIMAIGLLALAVNAYVLRLLARQRSAEVHMRAAWIFTRADVIAFDLAIGLAIGLNVIKDAFEIVRETRGV